LAIGTFIVNFLSLTILLLPVWAYAIGIVWAARQFASRRPDESAEHPAVSLLKPLHGAEPGLYENLRSFVDQDYPAMQTVFGVQDPDDQALPSVRRLIAERPDNDLIVVVDPRANGSNLKIANLENILGSARHDVLVMADSDMRVTRSYLAEVIAPLQDPKVGLVTCLYKGVGTGGLWSELGAMHINFGFLPSALLAETMGWGGGCFGATVALRRRVLDRIGGFARLRNELADDHRIGSAVRELGLNTFLSRCIVENRVSEPSLASLWRHELRWARTARLMAPGGFAGSVITHTMVIALLAALAAGFGPGACAVLLISCLLRWSSAAMIARMLGLPHRRLWLLPLRDALSFSVFVASFCGRSVSWRDQVFQVDEVGRMTAEGDKPV
jgi:ceramide glucosyltransferase